MGQWREVAGYEGLYLVSDDGQIFALPSIVNKGETEYVREGKILSPNLRGRGDLTYYFVRLTKDGESKTHSVHRLVAEAFIPNPNHLPQINHKDGNAKNNQVDNLEWCTCQDNLLHSFRILKRKPSITTAKIIKLTNKQTKETLYFSTEKDCAFYLNMSYEHLSKLLTGYHDIDKWKKGKLYKVEYSDIEDVTTIPKGSTE